jgi:ATP-dependent RNA helicase DHX57
VDGALDCLTTIVIDEVHERNLDGDILLGLLKAILPLKPHLSVVLMSATLDSNKFKTYWGNQPIPHVHIPGRTFPVVDFFLEDVLRLTGYIPSKTKKGYKLDNRSSYLDSESNLEDNENDKGDENERPQSTATADIVQHDTPIEDLVNRVDETSPDPTLICRLLQHIILSKDVSDNGSILVFLAGAPEIRNMENAIKNQIRDLPITILPLHGGLQPKEQGRVFQSAHAGYTKIVLSTNVAETSVTIPDCTVVIDT